MGHQCVAFTLEPVFVLAAQMMPYSCFPLLSTPKLGVLSGFLIWAKGSGNPPKCSVIGDCFIPDM